MSKLHDKLTTDPIVSPRPSLEDSGTWIKIGTNEVIEHVVPYRPERPPKWQFWKSEKQYLAVVTKSQKLYIVDFNGKYPSVSRQKQA